MKNKCQYREGKKKCGEPCQLKYCFEHRKRAYYISENKAIRKRGIKEERKKKFWIWLKSYLEIKRESDLKVAARR